MDAFATIMSPAQASPTVSLCAIDECPNACYIDESGTVHECCGYTHAMEHQRRQALWQRKCSMNILYNHINCFYLCVCVCIQR